MNQNYNQTPKKWIRETVLPTAVELLTSKRNGAVILRSSEVSDVVEYVLETATFSSEVENSIRACFEDWKAYNDSEIGGRKPGDLKVLYLCGPEPLNDLEVLVANGINSHNVWGVTSSKADIDRAAEELRTSGHPMKLHRGSLADFFESYNETFDIIYYDACGHILSKKPSSVTPLLRIFTSQRLSPHSVLITNFCEPPEESDDRTATENAITAFYRFRYRDIPQVIHNAYIDPEEFPADDSHLHKFISMNLEFMYSEFVTKLIRDLACNGVPMSRAVSIRSLRDIIVDEKKAKKALIQAEMQGNDDASIEEWFRTVGDMVIVPGAYPLHSFFKELKAKGVQELVEPIQQAKINGQSLGELIKWASLLDSIFEGHLDCLSEKMKMILGSVLWFDEKFPFGCDTPLPNLFVNSMLGIYGRPWFMNAVSVTCLL